MSSVSAVSSHAWPPLGSYGLEMLLCGMGQAGEGERRRLGQSLSTSQELTKLPVLPQNTLILCVCVGGNRTPVSPPESVCGNSTAQCASLRRRGLWGVLCHAGGAPMKGISVLIKEPPRSSAVLLPLEDTGSQVCTWKRVLTRTSHAGPSSWTSSLQNSLRPPPLSAIFFQHPD